MTLSSQIAAARPEEQREMLEKAWEFLFPGDREEDFDNWTIFDDLLDIGTNEAFTAAALMLRPKDCGFAVYPNWAEIMLEGGRVVTPINSCVVPALAIAAACVRAKEEQSDG